MILKLTPNRRLLLLISVILLFISRPQVESGNVQYEPSTLLVIGFLVLLCVLALELKDKLLAHDELQTGRAVQSALIPSENPEISGWTIWMYTRPANEVGGDLVDYIHLDDGRLGVFLADVAGKGLGAALFMAKLQATVRALVPGFKSLSKLGSEINTIFCRDGLPNRFISLLYMELKSDHNRLKLLNAGHFPPIIEQKGRLIELKHNAPALGIVREPSFKEQYIDLSSGEWILIYSDGVTEARNEKGEFFGEKRLMDELASWKGISVNDMGEHLLEKVDHFIGNERPNDDLSLIILKRG
jgi:sigma-B regulation protein RsbU (phosphoserine phosphatase)